MYIFASRRESEYLRKAVEVREYLDQDLRRARQETNFCHDAQWISRSDKDKKGLGDDNGLNGSVR